MSKFVNNSIDTSNNEQNLTNQTNNNKNNIEQKYLNDEMYLFGNFYGLISEKYIRFFNLFALQLLATIIFSVIYYFLLLDFDKYFYIPQGLPRGQFLNNKMLVAIIMSVNFQTSTAYVDIKGKTMSVRILILFQLVLSFMITFLFLIVK
jgi:hypothetical protein